MFHGTYTAEDVTFLLKQINIQETDISDKEKLIQTGKKHYSQMLSLENPPSDEYISVFHESLELNKIQFAKDVLYLSSVIADKENPVIVSLARAGTPVGVLVKRTLKEIFKVDIPHYSVSIIRDKGLDLNALKFINDNHPDSEIIFLDGWTGKGVISRQLKKSVSEFNQKYNTNISDKLYVLADISGSADFCATNKDYLIPSAIFNSTISGLISRTVTDIEEIGLNDFHGCKFYTDLLEHDISLWFIEHIMDIIINLDLDNINKPDLKNQEVLKQISENFLNDMMIKYSIDNINHIKPGIGETTRVLLRRVPEKLLIKNKKLKEIKHLLILAQEKGCSIEELADMPYNAVGLIAKVKG